jgi:Tfp pilus assembly protein PilF
MGSLMEIFDPYGTVPGSSLNWSQHAALQSAAQRPVVASPSIVMPTIDTNRIESELEVVGANVSQAVGAIYSLESELGLQLDAQAELLSRQTNLLEEIAHTLHSPGHTRAAERLRDATELLRHKRYKRALGVTEQAIEDDPNNDTAFMAAGWACRGLERAEDARNFFREAAQATDYSSPEDFETRERHVHAVLLAARLTYALEGPQAAYSELAQLEADPHHPKTFAAIHFDRAIYLAANQDASSAIENLQKAIDIDPRYGFMALTDPILASNEVVYRAAIEQLHRRKELVDQIREMLRPHEEYLSNIREWLKRYDLLKEPKMRAWLGHRVAALLTPGSRQRKAVLEKDLESMGSPYLKLEYLERGAAAIAQYFRGFTSDAIPLIDREKAREDILEEAVANEVRYRDTRQIYRGRLDAVLGRRGLRTFFSYTFWRLTVEVNSRITATDITPTKELKDQYRRARK